MKKILIMVMLTTMAFSQYNADGEKNTVLTWSLYKWTPMSEVEDGSNADRAAAVAEYNKKRNQASKLLKSSMFLTHYWTGAVEDVHRLNEFKDMNEATIYSGGGENLNPKAWGDADERKAAVTANGKYFDSYHEDLHIFENHVALEKKRIGGYGDWTYVAVTVSYLKPLGAVEGGSREERYKLMKKFQKEVIGKNPKILSQRVLTHLWSGKIENGLWPVVTVSEYNSMEDVDNAGDDNPALWQKAFSEAEGSAYAKYWDNDRHEDLGLFMNFTPANK